MNQPQKQNWWNRNWKWFVPVGCLGTLIVIAGFFVGVCLLVFGLAKSSYAYKDALAKAKSHPAVQETLGTPIEEGLFVTGSINTSGPSGRADLAIPISGPRGKGTIYVVASKSAGQWTYSTLVVEIKDTRQRIDLLE